MKRLFVSVPLRGIGYETPPDRMLYPERVSMGSIRIGQFSLSLDPYFLSILALFVL